MNYVKIIKKMKIKLILFIAIITVVVCGCSKNKTDNKLQNEFRALNADMTNEKGPFEMQASKSNGSVVIKNKTYNYSISRTPDSSLAKVSNERNEQFIDNKITLHITCNGSNVFNKAFVKSDFSNYVEASFLKKSILEGLVYNKVAGNNILFAASVCYPQTDLYIPLTISISTDGKMSISRNDNLEDLYEAEGVE